jgi:hypothetical protein
MSQIAHGGDLISLLTDGDIANLDTLVSKRTGGSNGNPQYPDFHKEWRSGGAAQTTPVGNQWHSLWTLEGRPCHGAAPGAWANPVKTTAGAWQQANAGGGRALRMYRVGALLSTPGMLVVYDRLGANSGLNGTLTSAQNINGGAAATISRYTTGERNELWLEIYTALGSTATTATVVYTNQAGTTLRTSAAVTIGAANRNESGRIIKVSLAQGDYGVRDVTSVTLAASTLTAGDFGVTIARPLFYIPIAVLNAGTSSYFMNGPFPKIQTDACLALAYIADTTTSPITDGFSELLEV